MTEYLPSEKGVPIRYPSVANLMVDSADRDIQLYSNPFNFQITKPNSLLNGFFTRVGTTEVVLEWCNNNITYDCSSVIIDISGTLGNTYAGQKEITLNTGLYNVEDVLDTIVDLINIQTPVTNVTFNVSATPAGVYLTSDLSGVFKILPGCLANKLDLVPVTPDPLTGYYDEVQVKCPDLRPYRYIDFVSSQLTYCQDVKDASTAKFVRDVLCRWYFSYDEANILDGYGFPILMGYTRFCTRRLYNPPKQIRWENNLPVGNIAFEVYGYDGKLITDFDDKSNFLMTLQISEV